MFNLNAIAKHLKTTTTAIVRVEEWANCLFVVAKGIGGRFVSKKIGEVMYMDSLCNLPELIGSEKQIKWASDIRREFFSTEDHPVTKMKTPINWAKRIIDEAAVEGTKQHFEKILLKNLIQKIIECSEASWWIENRGSLWAPSFYHAWQPALVSDQDRVEALKQSGYIPKRGKNIDLYNKFVNA